MAIKRGSEWHRWDLHIHTPGTKLNDQYRDSEGNPISKSKNEKIWKEYCSALNESGNKCFGITDYFSIENYLYLKENRDRIGLNKDIEIFPNIELRVTGLVPKGKSRSPHKHVNLHVIFSNDSSKVKVKDLKSFLRNIIIKNDENRSINYFDDFNELFKDGCFSYLPDYSEVEKSLADTFGEKYKEIALILMPNGNDGLSNEKGTNQNANLKFMKNSVDIIQTASLKDRNFFLNKDCHEKYGRRFPCISGSDAHDFDSIKNYPLDKSTWIKAEPSFEGLKSILYEPEYRVKIQETDPATKLSSKVISYINLPQKNFSNKTVYFNDDLNVIIGGRSSGKSLLLSLLGKKAYAIENVKGHDSKYDSMISELVEDTRLYNKQDEEIKGEMIIEFFHQDKLQEIARNGDDRKRFIEETLGTSESVFNTLRNIDIKKTSLKGLIHKIIQKKESLEVLKIQNINLQDKEILKKNIIDIEENIGKVSLTFSEEEKKEIKENNIRIEEHDNKITTLREKLNTIKDLLDKDIIEVNKDLIKDSIELLEDDFQTLIVEINSLNEKYRNQLKALETKLLKDKAALIEKIENINSQHLMSTYLKSVDSRPELERMTLSLKQEKKKLTDRVNYDNEVKKHMEEIVSLSVEICNEISWEKFEFEEKILRKDNLAINHNVSINHKILAEVFSRHLKIGQKVYKNIAVGSFEEIIGYEDNNFKLDHGSFIETLKNILLYENNDVFKSEKNLSSFLSELSDLNYIISDYNILYEDLDFEKMSEGKKALVLLLIKLELGQEDCPILIDQPEDDLDNRSIIEDVIGYFKEEKLKRQVFIVTHNANIVIACDSENVIIANEHDAKNPNPDTIKYYYSNGGLEETKIRSKVCEILEGGEDAFKARESRYIFTQ